MTHTGPLYALRTTNRFSRAADFRSTDFLVFAMLLVVDNSQRKQNHAGHFSTFAECTSQAIICVPKTYFETDAFRKHIWSEKKVFIGW